MQVERNCPLLDSDDIELKKDEVSRAPAKRYDIKFNNKTKLQKEEEKAKKKNKKRVILNVLDYEFFYCPSSSLIDNRGLTGLIDLINWSSDMHTPLLDGGLLHHTNYFFECHRTVISEQKKIESEEMKKSREDAKTKGNKNKGSSSKRGARVGRASRARRR